MKKNAPSPSPVAADPAALAGDGAAPAGAALPRFAIVTLPRSGSYHLVSLLDSAPDIVCHGEIFKRELVELRKQHLEKLEMTTEDTARRDEDPLRFLTRLRAVNRRKLFGFKMFPEHYRRLPAVESEVVNAKGWRKVFLVRNPIESYASLLRARRTGLWTMDDAKRRAASEDELRLPVTFDAASFDEHAKLCGWFEDQVRRVRGLPGNPCFVLPYERINDEAMLDELLGFLGSTSRASQLESRREKQFAGRVPDGFANWTELAAHARATGRGEWVDAAERA